LHNDLAGIMHSFAIRSTHPSLPQREAETLRHKETIQTLILLLLSLRTAIF